MPLHFVRRERFESVYRVSGTAVKVRLPHLSERYDLDSEVLHHFWNNRPNPYSYSVSLFQQYIAERLINPDDADEIRWCGDCSRPSTEDDADDNFVWIHSSEETVCESCSTNYHECYRCSELSNDVSSTLDDRTVCEPCIENYYAHCERCDGYYNPDFESHDHDESCSCEAPGQKFTVSVPEGKVQQDSRTAVTLPPGDISETGITAIRRLIRKWAQEDLPEPTSVYKSDNSYQYTDEYLEWSNCVYGAPDLVYSVGSEARNGEGTFARRLSRAAWKDYKIKLPADLITAIGNMASDNSRAVDVLVEFTRHYSGGAEAFYHEDSCWWQGYGESLCSLKASGGIGVRSYGNEGDHFQSPNGRAWAQPVKYVAAEEKWVPTFDTENNDGFIVYNGYGALSGYNAARILAAGVEGWTYRKGGFVANPQYVNGDQGILVTSPDLIDKGRDSDGYLILKVDECGGSLYYREQRTEQSVPKTVPVVPTARELVYI